MDQQDVTFLGIFPCNSADRANVLFPRCCMVLHPIKFGLIIPDKTAKEMRAHENLESLTQAKLFPGLYIIRVHI